MGILIHKQTRGISLYIHRVKEKQKLSTDKYDPAYVGTILIQEMFVGV